MGDQRVDERAGRVACPRMHDEPCRLVDDDERVVLVNHVERDRFGAGLRRRHGREIEGEAIARFDPVFHVAYGPPVQGDAAVFDEALHAGAAQLRQALGQEAVEPQAFVAGFRLGLKPLEGGRFG